MAPKRPAFLIAWLDSGLFPTRPANPSYPNGVILDATGGQENRCTINLPYPAPRCGQWHVECGICGFKCQLTAAGRADDPYAVRIPCQNKPIVLDA